ncbi:MAG: hypothetical protein ACOCP5_01650 [Halanaerobiaceae bacterium]
MNTQRKAWLIWLIILVISAYIIPYFILKDIDKITGPFLFWTIYALLAIISTFMIINKWRN